MLKPNSALVLEYVKNNEGKDIIAADSAKGTGLEVKQVNGIVTAAFCKKGYMERIPAEVQVKDENGNLVHKTVKFIKLTDAGRKHDFTKEDNEQ